MKIAASRILWKKSYRIVPSRYPTVNPFEKVAEESDWEALFEIEGMTNDRLRHSIDEIRYFDEKKIPLQNNRSYILAPFTHLNPSGSRFSDGSFGVFYAAKSLSTAIAETKFHRENFMKATREKAMNLEMRVVTTRISGVFQDLRQKAKELFRTILNPKSYESSQKLARELREKASQGILYPSVREKEQGDCVAVFNPERLSDCQIDRHLIYRWNGSEIDSVLEIKEI